LKAALGGPVVESVREAGDGVVPMPRWVIESVLARCHRPGFDHPGPGKLVGVEDLDRWLDQVAALGIRSILAILARPQCERFASIPGGLLGYYRNAGFEAEMIEAEDDRFPPLTGEQLELAWSAFQRLPKPVLIHCGAGVNRTGAAVAYIQDCLGRTQEPPTET
jgi:Tyrosine phosphatase family